jgi:hypothetical protein
MVKADGEGRLALPAEEAQGAIPEGFRWKSVRQTSQEIERTGVFWVYDEVSIRVEVDFQPRGTEASFEKVSVSAVLPVAERSQDPFNLAWLLAHRLEPGPFEGRPQVGDPGVFQVMVPRLPRITLVGWKEGWRPASLSLEVPPDSPELYAHLSLTPGLKIDGVLRDEHGMPIANAVVDAFVVRSFPWDFSRDSEINAEMSRKFSPNGGVAISRTRDSRLVVRVHERGVTDAEGKFTIFTKSEGRIGLYVFEKGRRGVSTDLGEIQSNQTGLELSAPANADGQFVAFLEGGEPVKATEISRVDCSDPLEPSVVLPLDGQGRVPAEWFRAGHLYHVRAMGRGLEARGFLKWDGRASIDLATLAKEPPEEL